MNINREMKNLVTKVKQLQRNFERKLDSNLSWAEAKRFATNRGKGLARQVNNNKDVKNVMAYVEQRRKQLERVSKQLPKEVRQMKTFVNQQKKELEKIGGQLVRGLKSHAKQSGSRIMQAANGGVSARPRRAASKRKSRSTTRRRVRR